MYDFRFVLDDDFKFNINWQRGYEALTGMDQAQIRDAIDATRQDTSPL